MIEIFYKHTLSKNDVVFYLKSDYFKYENRTYLKYIGSTKKFETNSEEDQVVFHKMFKEISQTHFEDDHIVFHKIFKEIKDFELTLRLYITAINAKYKESFFVKVINSPASHIMCAKENKIDSFKLVVWKNESEK